VSGSLLPGAGCDRRRVERGNATLLMATCALVLLTVGGMAVLWGIVSSANHRASSAADLAALSAAAAIQRGEREPCEIAAAITARHGAGLAACEVTGEDVRVVATVAMRLGSLGTPSARATARAGPG
jgi:secretion/DNA translocation related TadE-like protein